MTSKHLEKAPLLWEIVTPSGGLASYHNKAESLFLCIMCMFPVGIQDTRWTVISWTAACPVKTLTSWAALRTATFTAGTWWKWVSVYLCPCPAGKLFYGTLMFFSFEGVFVLETSSGESCCPVAVLPPDRDYPPHSHGETCPGLGCWARRGSNGHIESSLIISGWSVEYLEMFGHMK